MSFTLRPQMMSARPLDPSPCPRDADGHFCQAALSLFSSASSVTKVPETSMRLTASGPRFTRSRSCQFSRFIATDDYGVEFHDGFHDAKSPAIGNGGNRHLKSGNESPTKNTRHAVVLDREGQIRVYNRPARTRRQSVLPQVAAGGSVTVGRDGAGIDSNLAAEHITQSELIRFAGRHTGDLCSPPSTTAKLEFRSRLEEAIDETRSVCDKSDGNPAKRGEVLENRRTLEKRKVDAPRESDRVKRRGGFCDARRFPTRQRSNSASANRIASRQSTDELAGLVADWMTCCSKWSQPDRTRSDRRERLDAGVRHAARVRRRGTFPTLCDVKLWSSNGFS